MVLHAGGNILIGTNVDSGYKLDVNGTARFLGNTLIQNTAGGTALLQLVNNATSPDNNNWSIIAGFGGVRQFQIRDNLGGARFTIDGNGDATFLKSITANAASTINAAETYLNAILKLNTTGILGSTGGYIEYSRSNVSKFYAGIGVFDGLDNYQIGVSTPLLTISSTGYSTFTGAIAIGNNVNASAPDVNTHKVEIEIGGNTYYLLATENP
jgi:hypothetical protein